MMDDREQFERQLQQNPNDWPLRLVYSDWLEEHGEDAGMQRLLACFSRLGGHLPLPRGTVLLQSDGEVQVGDYITSDSEGRAIRISTGTQIMGVCTQSLGDLIAVMLYDSTIPSQQG